MTTDIASRSGGRLLAPKSGWSTQALPSAPGTTIQYRNNQDSRVLAVLGQDGFWKVLCTNINQVVHFFAWAPSRLVGDLDEVDFIEIVLPPSAA